MPLSWSQNSAAVSLSVLPVNYAGLALLLLGIALMVAEAFLPSFGIAGIGGVVAFALGALFLFDPEQSDIPIQVSWQVVAGLTAWVRASSRASGSLGGTNTARCFQISRRLGMSPSTSAQPESAALLLVILVCAARAGLRPVRTGAEEMLGSIGEVVYWEESEGRIQVHGEIWAAKSGTRLAKGQLVRVVSRTGLTLAVEPSS